MRVEPEGLADQRRPAPEVCVVLAPRFMLADGLRQVDHFVRHDDDQAVVAADLRLRHPDEVRVRAAVAGVISLAILVARDPEANAFGRQLPSTERRAGAQRRVDARQDLRAESETHAPTLSPSRARRLALRLRQRLNERRPRMLEAPR